MRSPTEHHVLGSLRKEIKRTRLVCSPGSPGFLGPLCVRPQAGDRVRGSVFSETGTLLWLIKCLIYCELDLCLSKLFLVVACFFMQVESHLNQRSPEHNSLLSFLQLLKTPSFRLFKYLQLRLADVMGSSEVSVDYFTYQNRRDTSSLF